MEQGRILILGQTKEHTYEVRNLLDNRKFEVEIVLSAEVAKTVLVQRVMNLLVLHTEVPEEAMKDFIEFCTTQGVELPLFIFGEETSRVSALVPSWMEVKCFDKPYAADQVFGAIHELELKNSQATVGLNPDV
ncbi:MAG: hypothetical protein MK538_02950 [Planctomycetes bacterium]|nr:hypothetical protein [Planctomycetota bacterium]